MSAIEANLDGLVGPTHNYAGLSFGNVASQKHAKSISNPKQAALEGLAKMKFVHDLGIPQMVMPPQPRPVMGLLKKLGYNKPSEASADLLAQIYSASSMWTANAATISPSADTRDGKLHITPANLISKLHRSVEAPLTSSYLKQIFSGSLFVHHDPLPAHAHFADEGAANHMRLCPSYGEKGIEIFVAGGDSKKYPARQSLSACEAIVSSHLLEPKRTVILTQNPRAIDAGVFHNDVIAMSNERLLIYHAAAFKSLDTQPLKNFTLLKISEKDLPLAVAVKTYFFNSQLITLPDKRIAVIAPLECHEHPKTRKCLDRLKAQDHIDAIYYLNVRESMKNGGGPACLRLRVVLTPQEQAAVHHPVWLNETLYNTLCRWITKHYRDKIAPDDLRDPSLSEESATALAELSNVIKMTLGEPHV